MSGVEQLPGSVRKGVGGVGEDVERWEGRWGYGRRSEGMGGGMGGEVRGWGEGWEGGLRGRGFVNRRKCFGRRCLTSF